MTLDLPLPAGVADYQEMFVLGIPRNPQRQL
jgi:hypothetical protein